jgi:hypothetical protein
MCFKSEIEGPVSGHVLRGTDYELWIARYAFWVADLARPSVRNRPRPRPRPRRRCTSFGFEDEDEDDLGMSQGRETSDQ